MLSPTTESLIARVTTGRRAERLVAILDQITQRGTISLTELSDGLGVSPATLRRDLSDLADQNLIVRTHGGATALERGGHEIPVALRDTRFQEAKRAIARATVRRLPTERYVVALSGGTTTASVARALANHRDITIVTNSLTIANLLSSNSDVRVAMTGGFLRPQSLELVGALAESTFNAVNVGTAILGADGVSATAGVTTHDETEARTNRAMVVKAQRTVVVADGSKIGNVAMAQVADMDQVELLITDSSADPTELERLRAAGVQVVVADQE
ncbi:DeoR/GlpR family DNA-binding transcription regulator [Leifsonia sp. SIMBA_070]|uniref:DeoR/GlpR family DNA-binding transcription regulator n=1 Tax=Leifsonia sp. SIMBA_070 TaxID=3085810 RepID=UPI00397AB199